MIVSIPDVWQLAKQEHQAFIEKIADAGLAKLDDSEISSKIRKFVADNWNAIVGGNRLDLAASIAAYEELFGNGSLRLEVSEKLSLIFDFSDFSKKSAKPWTAYKLCVAARYKVCSYCHMVSTGTCLPDEDTKGYRPPIDHYYAKSEYPFLALTLTNFIPCCEKCNGSQMKGAINFAKKHHLNPLFDDESINFTLEPVAVAGIDIAEALALKLDSDHYTLKLTPALGSPESTASIVTFQLESRYKEYSGQAYHLARRLRGLNARLRMQDDALEFATTLNDNLEFKVAEYKNAPYGKARLCIAKQYGVLP
ncbi:hypothetical protein IFU20_16495 [Pseudomonas viridiflava]|uniref:hypothetical protein n=1 Tax=Pseudomonas viridiflava TaxID=33069 RepID=UPI0017855F52|nr:hypothetical protein [Pseudomonas viridiflava]MBD8187786.1 hypothetical protein [Pseudomonas viridiflava]